MECQPGGVSSPEWMRRMAAAAVRATRLRKGSCSGAVRQADAAGWRAPTRRGWRGAQRALLSAHLRVVLRGGAGQDYELFHRQRVNAVPPLGVVLEIPHWRICRLRPRAGAQRPPQTTGQLLRSLLPLRRLAQLLPLHLAALLQRRRQGARQEVAVIARVERCREAARWRRAWTDQNAAYVVKTLQTPQRVGSAGEGSSVEGRSVVQRRVSMGTASALGGVCCLSRRSNAACRTSRSTACRARGAPQSPTPLWTRPCCRCATGRGSSPGRPPTQRSAQREEGQGSDSASRRLMHKVTSVPGLAI